MEQFLNISRKVIPAILVIILIVNLFILLKDEVNADSYRYTYNGNNIDTSKYPGVKEKIDILKKNHPNWTFTIMETGLDWNQVIKAEYSGHWGSPLNLIQGRSGSWICSICGDHLYDNGSWRCASEMAIRYYMDPRNWLVDNEYLFQFLQIDYIDSSDDAIYNALANTFLHDREYAKQINEACRESNVNPYYIIARVMQEQGSTGKGSWKMQDGGTTYYNLFNIGASGNSPAEILKNSLATAKARGWTSVKASIKGGVNTLTDYINAKQNTQYLNKFDVETYAGTYIKQYMQNIEAPKNEASSMYSSMKNAGLIDQKLNFIIPVYTNMPSASSTSPDGIGEVAPKNIRVKPGHTDVILRSTASTSGSVLYTIPDSSIVLLSVERFNNGWHKVVLTDGRSGYIKFDNSYLEQIDDVVNCYENKVINSDGVPMYVGPGSSQTLLTTLSYGQSVTRIDNTGRYSFNGTTWDRIVLADGRQGFVERKYLKDLDLSETFTIKADGGLYLKSKPSMKEEDRIRLLANGGKVTRIGTYTENGVEVTIGGYHWDYVITADGAKGYVAREYLRDANGNVPGSYTDGLKKTKVDGNILYTIPSVTVEQLKNEGVTGVQDKNGKEITLGLVGTGMKATMEGKTYTIVKMGDVSGDGEVDSRDSLRVLKYSVGTYSLKDEYAKAADVNLDGEIDSRDSLRILKSSVGTYNIGL